MRGQRLTTEQHAHAREELDALLADLHVVEVSDSLIADAAELAEQEGLRGYDAVHLAVQHVRVVVSLGAAVNGAKPCS